MPSRQGRGLGVRTPEAVSQPWLQRLPRAKLVSIDAAAGSRRRAKAGEDSATRPHKERARQPARQAFAWQAAEEGVRVLSDASP